MLHIYLGIGGLGAIGYGLMMVVDPDGTRDRARGPSSLHFWTVATITFGIIGLGFSALPIDPGWTLGVASLGALGIAAWRSRPPGIGANDPSTNHP